MNKTTRGSFLTVGDLQRSNPDSHFRPSEYPVFPVLEKWLVVDDIATVNRRIIHLAERVGVGNDEPPDEESLKKFMDGLETTVGLLQELFDLRALLASSTSENIRETKGRLS